jgi:WD40 repeat protein
VGRPKTHELDAMNTPASGPRILIRQSCGYEVPIHGIAMAGWNRLISIGADNKIRLHNPETGRTLDTFEGFKRFVTGIRALDDQIALLFFTTQYALLDLDTGRIEESEGAPRSVLATRLSPAQIMAAPMLAPATFSPPRNNEAVAEARLDPSHVVYVSEDRLNDTRNQYFHLWNVPRGREIRSFWGVDSEALSLVALDGRRVLSSHEDEHFRIWDVETSEQVRRIEHRRGKVGPMMLIDKAALLFAPVDPTESQRLRHFHWGPSDRTLRLWDLEKVGERAVLECEAAIVELARVDSRRFWARDEKSCLHLIEVLR